jgi:hypothetical protein
MKKVYPQLARYYANRDAINSRRRAYRAAHRAEVNIKAKVYRETRKEEIRKYNSEYAKKIKYIRLRKVSTDELIAEMLNRRPDCSKCCNSEIHQYYDGCQCVWAHIKDNFTEGK